MAPSSPGTDQIETLLWIGLVAAVIVVVAVNAALLYVVRRNRAARGAAPRALGGGGGLQLRVGGTLAAFATVLFVLGVVFTDRAREAPATGENGLAVEGEGEAENEPLTIKATGQQWLWRYDYPNGAFSYYKLVVPVDTAVRLELETTDVVHTWDVPDLVGKRDAVPGKVHTTVFRADEEGTYAGQSATLSGQAYAAMRTAVEVVSTDDYEEYVEELKAEIDSAQEEVVETIESGETP